MAAAPEPQPWARLIPSGLTIPLSAQGMDGELVTLSPASGSPQPLSSQQGRDFS